MTYAAAPTRIDPRPVRSVELVLARAHLRLGSLALARTELETLAGLGKLDVAGLVDLAEVRWRTGDLSGAGEAARAALRGDEDEPVALLIAAEAAAALGRPSEARRLASRAMASATGSIDVIFAGMPRSAAWPPDVDEPPPTAPTLFDRAPEPPARPDGTRPGSDEPAPAKTRGSAATPVALGFWDEATPEEPATLSLPDPALELEAGRAALVAGNADEAALRLALALRLAPALAPAVLEATAGARVAGLILVRGDAYRFGGHEPEAREAYAVAARGGLPERRRHSRLKPSTTEAPSTDSDPAITADLEEGDEPAESTGDTRFVDGMGEPDPGESGDATPDGDAPASGAEPVEGHEQVRSDGSEHLAATPDEPVG